MVRFNQKCNFCGGLIPKGAPGATTGTRGTKAYYHPELDRWECKECRGAGSRAEEARRVMGDVARRAVEWEPGMDWDVLFNRERRLVTGRRALHAAVNFGTAGALRAVWAEGATTWREPW